MRIVNRIEFLKLPPGTLFSKYTPCFFDELMIKGTSLPNDFMYQDLIGNVKCSGVREFVDILNSVEKTGVSFELDFDCQGRDGLFDSDQLFAIYEDEDVNQLIHRLVNRFQDEHI